MMKIIKMFIHMESVFFVCRRAVFSTAGTQFGETRTWSYFIYQDLKIHPNSRLI